MVGGDENTGFLRIRTHTLLFVNVSWFFKRRCLCVTRFKVYMVKSVALLVGDECRARSVSLEKGKIVETALIEVGYDVRRIEVSKPSFTVGTINSSSGCCVQQFAWAWRGRWNHSVGCSWDARHSFIPIPVFWRLWLVWISRYVVFQLSPSMFLSGVALLLFPKFWPVKFCLLLYLWSLFRKVPVCS